MENFKKWIGEHKRDLILCIIALLVLAGVFIAGRHSVNEGAAEVPIQTVTDTAPAAIKEAQINSGKFISDADAKEVSRRIERAQQQAPTYQYFTGSDKAADAQAEKYAAADHADYVIKEQSKAAEVPAGAGSSTIYENKYYGITQERKHEIKAGAAYVNDKPAAIVSYRNRDVEYSAYTDGHKLTGAAVQITVAKW